MPAPARGRRRWFVLALLLGALGLGAWWVDRQLEPQRLTATVLRQLGASLGLELSIRGQPEYSLRPEPRLLLPNLVVRLPGESAALLTAVRAEVSLPWATLTDSDAALVITRIELEQPVLNLPALRRWQAKQPDEPFELPRLTRGLHASNATVRDESWSLQALSFELPALAEGEPVSIRSSGQLRTGTDLVELEAAFEMARAAIASPVSLAARGHWTRDQRRLPFDLSLAGDYDDAGGARSLRLAKLSLDSESPLPDFSGTGSLRHAGDWTLALSGQLADWPKDWPALPPPVSESASPLQASANYQGASDFSGPLSVVLTRDETRVEAALHWPQLQAWLDAADGSPLPPLTGIVTSPQLEIEGATLEGVRVEIGEDPPAAPATPAP